MTTHHPRCTETAGYCVHQYRRDIESCPYCDLIEAEEAAETYHAAWQDAAVYWKAERDDLREQVARQNQDKAYMIDALGEMTERCYKTEEDRDRLRAALEKYGRHLGSSRKRSHAPPAAPIRAAGRLAEERSGR